MDKYLNFFGEYKKIKLINKETDEIIDLLDNFININSHLYSNKLGEHNSIIINLMNNNIDLYEFSFKEADSPKSKYEENIYTELMKISKGRSGWRTWIYWRAFNFFKSKGLYIKTISGVSNYLTLDTKNRLDYIYLENTMEEEGCNQKYIIDNYETIIRCGEISEDRVISELCSEKYLWIFPYIDETMYDRNSLKCYLLKAKKDFSEVRYKHLKEEFQKVSDVFKLGKRC